MMQISFFALTLAGLSAGTDVSRRLLNENRRRLNMWDDIGKAGKDIAHGAEKAANDIANGAEKAGQDIAHGAEDIANDAADAAKDIANDVVDIGNDIANDITKAFDKTGLDDVWTWTENAAVTAWSDAEGFLKGLGCMVENELTTCTTCVRDACNASLSDDVIDSIDGANNVAIRDMNDEFDPMFEACASALAACPSVTDCDNLNDLPESTQAVVSKTIEQCNMCYQCLPYGSTQEGCKPALDQSFGSDCDGCTEDEQNLYNAIYSCSSLELINDSIAELGEFYAPGADGYDAMNEICDSCLNCSDHGTQLYNTCSNWSKIKHGWDRTPPAVPAALSPSCVEDCCWEEGNSASDGEKIPGVAWPARVDTVEECAQLCVDTPKCNGFHYYGPRDNYYRDCYLKQGVTNVYAMSDNRNRQGGFCGMRA